MFRIVYPFLCLLLYGCGILAPFKEKERTVKKINLAQSINAQRYSEEDFTTSKSLFEEARVLFVTNKKSPANAKAKQLLLKSEKLALNAYSNSLPPYTKDIIQSTDKSIEVARQNKANITFENEFSNISKRQKKAKSLLVQKQYESTITTTQDVKKEIDSLNQKTLEIKGVAEDLRLQADALNIQAQSEKVHIALPDAFNEVTGTFNQSTTLIKEGRYQGATNLLVTFSEAINKLLETTRLKKQSSIKSYSEAYSNLKEVRAFQSNERNTVNSGNGKTNNASEAENVELNNLEETTENKGKGMIRDEELPIVDPSINNSKKKADNNEVE